MLAFKSMLGTAKKNSYLKEKLGPFYIVHTDQHDSPANEGGVKKSKSSNIVWDFNIGDDEDQDFPITKMPTYPSSKLTKNNPTDI